ncbi:MAG: hypothetical protein NTW66_01520 [Candidatus Magasanikbacteria bacterium]|nr:hypothetical protein [Candidatus Magasanikbacteria bacterium]
MKKILLPVILIIIFIAASVGTFKFFQWRSDLNSSEYNNLNVCVDENNKEIDCVAPQKYVISDKEPLLLLAEERFIFCQNGKIFREMPSYPERNTFYFITQLGQSQINQIKNFMGSKEIIFSGNEYEIPDNIMPAKYPDHCDIEYNGCCDGIKEIDFNECNRLHKKANEYIKGAGFNVEKNYKTLVEISIDKGMSIPVVDADYATQINKLCNIPVSNGKPVYDDVTWKVGAEKNNTFRFYSDIVVESIQTKEPVVPVVIDESAIRDHKRVSDIKVIQTALELYYTDNGKYPEKIEIGKQLSNDGVVYLQQIPSTPLPNDGNCPTNFQYAYRPLKGGNSYELEFCLGGASGQFHEYLTKVGP